jgi:solute:Na+ symporter, SSS family
LDPKATLKREIWVSRFTTLVLFAAPSAVAILFVKQMLGWFMFVNSAMVIFLLPLAFFRFFWWRFNVWGELAAIILGLPLSILIWFKFDFQDASKHPIWQGLGLLFGLSFVILTITTLLTPAESAETLTKFYDRCRPPGFWGPIRKHAGLTPSALPSFRGVVLNCLLGILACLGLVLATNAIFVGDWLRMTAGIISACLLGWWLIQRVFQPEMKARETKPVELEKSINNAP